MELNKLHLHWRAYQYKDKSYRSYSLARSYREAGKSRKEIIIKLGKLTEQEAQRWRELLKSLKDPTAFFTTFDNIILVAHFAYLDVAVINAVWDKWKLDIPFDNISEKTLQTATIARILTINRCVSPLSKSQTGQWFQKTSLPWLLGVAPKLINSSRIFRELELIETQKEVICKHLFDALPKQNPSAMEHVFYDLSSATFCGAKCVLVKWGHCKEGYRNHIVLAIVVNSEGLPFYWEVLQGGTADAKTISWLYDRLGKRFKIKHTTVVFDRGMVSDDNLSLLESDGIKYISAMDRNQIEELTGMDFISFANASLEKSSEQEKALAGFSKLNEITYYKEVKVENKRRYILCFNPQLYKDQQKAREQAINDFKQFVNDVNAELSEAKKARQYAATIKKFEKKLLKYKLNKYTKVELSKLQLTKKNARGEECNVNTYQASIDINEDEKKLSGKLNGFWLLVTNHSEKIGNNFQLSAQNAINPYRQKTIIESAFRDIKSFIEISPVYVWTEFHVKAHFTICVLSYLINRTLSLALHENEGDATSNVISHANLYQVLSGCKINQLRINTKDLESYKMTEPTEQQKELLERLDMTHL